MLVSLWPPLSLLLLTTEQRLDWLLWISKGLLIMYHFWSIGCRDKVFCQLKSYLSDRYITVVTPLDSSDISAGVPQGAIWSPLLFNLYICLLPRIPKHSLVIGYADDHTLAIIIPRKEDRAIAAACLSADLAALCEYGTLNAVRIPEVSSVKVLGFIFNSSLNWQNHINSVLNRGKQRLGQLYHC